MAETVRPFGQWSRVLGIPYWLLILLHHVLVVKWSPANDLHDQVHATQLTSLDASGPPRAINRRMSKEKSETGASANTLTPLTPQTNTILGDILPTPHQASGEISQFTEIPQDALLPVCVPASRGQSPLPRVTPRLMGIDRLRQPSLWSQDSTCSTSFSRAHTTTVSADLVSLGSARDMRETRIGSEFVTEVLNLWKSSRIVRGSITEEGPLLASHEVPVVIIGTGWIGRALAKRLVRAGVPTLMGSRNPNRFQNTKQSFSVACPVVSMPEALESARKILILAIPVDGHSKFAEEYGQLIMTNLTVVDVSNDQKPGAADRLGLLLPHARIVKAFNTVAAYHLNSEGQLPNPVMASGDADAKSVLQESVLKPLGFPVLDLGGAESFVQQERIPMRFFDKWRAAAAVSGVLFAFWLVYGLLWFAVWPTPAQYPGDKNAGQPMHGWEGVPLSVMNKVFALTGFSMLGVTYLPGQIAGCIQLYTGTAQCPFPALLGSWLNIRKFLGLLSLWFIGVHVLLSCLRLSRDYAYYPLYNHEGAAEWTGRAGEEKTSMTWSGELCMLLGVLSFSLFAVIAASSLPSVSAGLSWREFQFVQSTLGSLGLLLGFLHVFFYGAAFHLAGLSQDWVGWQYFPSSKIPPPHWTSLGIPGLALLLRFALALPGVSHRLNRIRKG